jgi:uncharacterized protein involved in type VI secretion and phage assembly
MNDDLGPRFYGKYRATVTSVDDPAKLGRIQVDLENFPVKTKTPPWCMPCVPYAGTGYGMFFIPEKGARVWIEFEGGDRDRPIWTGCFWDTSGPPPTASPTRKILRTPTSRLVLDDLDGKAGTLAVETIVRENKDPVSITFTKDAITIDATPAKITMTLDSAITITYPDSTITLQKAQTQAKVGSASSITVTANDQTLSTKSATISATQNVSVSGTSSVKVSTNQYTLSGQTVTITGTAINLG